MPCSRRPLIVSIALVALLVGMLALAGCAAGGGQSSSGTAKPAGMQMGTVKAAVPSDADTCADCSSGKKAPVVAGTPVVVDDVQVCKVGIKDGAYVPNQFTVQSTLPVRFEFTGKATGCLASPTFKSLGKMGDLREGRSVIDLGTLKPGTYRFACSMGMNAGDLVVR
jgi:hypothetical protein